MNISRFGLLGLVIGLACGIAVHAQAAKPSKPGSLPQTAYLFSYFINNGEDGLHLAWSTDGIVWTALNGGKSYITPVVGESKLMRDPCLVYCPDGIFRMVWTTSWGGQTIGYAWSKDLITWSEQTAVPVGAADKTNNCWAPELFYDDTTRQYVIFWSSTIDGRFPETIDGGDGNHRGYYTTTKDFKKFSPTKLFLEPGFNCIDATMVKHNGRYYLVFKDERAKPEWKKDLRTAVSDSATGPWKNISEPFTGHGVEGPSILKRGADFYVYFDGYTGGGYGAMRTRDWVKWEPLPAKLVVPPGTRHGSALAVPGKVIEKLLAPESSNAGSVFVGSGSVELNCAFDGAQIRYTLDGTQPTAKSKLYTGPVQLSRNTVIKAVSVFADGVVSRVASFEIKVDPAGK